MIAIAWRSRREARPAELGLPSVDAVLELLGARHDAPKDRLPLVFLGREPAEGPSHATDYAPLVPIDVDRAPAGWRPRTDAPGLAYTTSSHTLEAPRWRVVVELDRPPTRAEYPAITRACATRLGVDHDRCTESGSQRIYAPHAGAEVLRQRAAPWCVDELVREGGGLEVADARPRAHDVDDRAMRHPAALPERLGLWLTTPRDLPARAATSGALTGDRGMRALRPIVFAAIAAGVPLALVVDILTREQRGRWHAHEVEAACASAWRYSSTVAWESALPTIADAMPAVEGAAVATAALIVGPPGCGKTTRAIAVTRDAPSLLWITPRVKLAIDAAARVGAILYGDDGDRHATRLATTAASARKYLEVRWHTVVIDEIATVCAELDAIAADALRRACAQAERVIMLGADVDAEIAGIADEIVGRPMARVVLPGEPLPRELEIRHTNTVLPEIVARGKRPGECILIAMDTSVRAQALAQVLRDRHGSDYRVAVYVGGDDCGVPTDETVRTHDAIIATHSMAEAISITTPMAKVYVLHAYDHVHPRTLLQLAARARCVVDPRIVVGELAWRPRPAADPYDVADRIASLGGDASCVVALRCRWLRERRRSEARARPSLRDHAPAVGWPVVRVDMPPPGKRAPRLDRDLRESLRDHGDAVRDRDAERVVDVGPIHDRLPVRPTADQRAGAHAAALLRHGLPVDVTTARADRTGRVRSAVRRRALALLAEAPDRAALAAVCEYLEPRARADREGLQARAELDRDWLAAWPSLAEAEDAGAAALAWAKSRWRRLARAGLALPSKARALTWARAWTRALDAPLDAVGKYLEGAIPVARDATRGSRRSSVFG